MTDEDFMREALAEAQKALKAEEIPVGAIIEKDGVIIGRGHNLTESSKDPTAHAEIIAIRQAAQILGGWRLLGCRLYVTTEPCSMCAGAIVLARIPHLYIGTKNPKGGACGSVLNVVQEKKLNHYVDVEFGLLQEECQRMMQLFFKILKKKNQSCTDGGK